MGNKYTNNVSPMGDFVADGEVTSAEGLAAPLPVTSVV